MSGSAGTGTRRTDALSAQRAEHLFRDARRRAHRILPDHAFLLCDDDEQAVERLAGHIEVDIRVLLADQAVLCGLTGEAVVLLRELDPLCRLLDDRQEALRERVARRAPEVLGRGVVRPGENALRVRD